MAFEVNGHEYQAIEQNSKRPSRGGHQVVSTQALLAALDLRLRTCMNVCCLTDYDELIRTRGLKEHGIYYYVPSLLKHFRAADINELIVPRSHLSVNGRRDPLTPPKGVEKIRDHLLPLYRKYGKESDVRIELFDCEHVELPEMRSLILEWIDQHLASNFAT